MKKSLFIIGASLFLLGGTAVGENPKPAAGEAAKPPPGAMCLVPQAPEEIRCESSAGFLCVNTPAGGVIDNFIVIKGTVNQSDAVLSHMAAGVQHEYTKKLQRLTLDAPLTEKCWEHDFQSGPNFCLSKEGPFAIKIQLGEVGPYSILIAATRVSGTTEQKIVRTSRVVAPTVTNEVLSFDPAIDQGVLPEGTTHLKVNVDLLKGCEGGACDFIGASTGGVKVSTVNQAPDAGNRFIRCETKVVQGGAGKFIIGVPVLPGRNELQVTICNAALQSKSCPTLGPFKFSSGSITLAQEPAIEILSPQTDRNVLFGPETGSTLDLSFRVRGVDLPKTCGDEVQVTWNLESPLKLCSDDQGIFEVHLKPRDGYNMAHIVVNTKQGNLAESVAVGWGKPLSPFDARGQVRPAQDWETKEGVQVGLSQSLFNQMIFPALNHFLASDRVQPWLASLLENVGRGPVKKTEGSTDDGTQKALDRLKYCQGIVASKSRIKIIKPPTFKKIEFKPAQFSDDAVAFPMEVRDFDISIQQYVDLDGNGIPDNKEPLPLRIAFRRLRVTPIIRKGADETGAYWKLDSENTDCDTGDRRYCKKMPALFVPEKFIGGVSKLGSFVKCDKEQAVSPEMQKKCDALNEVNMQTGLLHEKVLNILNQLYACQASAALDVSAQKGWNLKLPLGIDLALRWGDSEINTNGIRLIAGTEFGSTASYHAWPQEIRSRQPGILVGGKEHASLTLSAPEANLGFAFRLDAINQALFAMEPKTFSVDPTLFVEIDKKCDAEEAIDPKKLDPICSLRSLRPRVQELLGSSMEQFGYLNSNHPLMLQLKPSQLFPVHLQMMQDKTLEVSLADWELSIFALQIDESQPVDAKGNPALKLDRDGHPQILPMGSGPIIRLKVGLILTAQLEGPLTDPKDPTQLLFKAKVLGEQSRWVITPVAGSNATAISPMNLVTNLKDKLDVSLQDILGKKGEEIPIPLPKSLGLTQAVAPEDSVLGRLGLERLTWGTEGLQLKLDSQLDRIEGLLAPILEQNIPIGGKIEHYRLPED